MSNAPLVQAIRQRLGAAGYSSLSTPFKVASVEFEFTGAMRGRGGRALDLVLLVDTTTGEFGDRDGARVRQRVEALSRALDVTGSRYVVTVILAGAVLADGIEALSEICRVLQVENIAIDDQGKPADEIAERQLDDRIRVLLPLTLPAPLPETQDGSGPAVEQLTRVLSRRSSRTLLDAVIQASRAGEEAVTEAAAGVIADALQADPEGEQS